ncbi:MAG: carbon monoxide dehydrogenase subunit G [Gammaproteobacteria bacterium]
MEMASEQRIPATRDSVWAALNNTEILQAAMPGCDSFEAVGENEFTAQVTTKVGPVKARFKFNVTLTDVDPPNGYTINGQGQGGAAGFAKGSAQVNLTEEGEDTILVYVVKANVGGKLAQLGSRLIDGTAKKMADEFFGNFIELVSGEAEGQQ